MASEKRQAQASRLRQTVLMVAVRNAGVRKGLRGVTYLVCWGLATEELGKRPTVEDYERVWKVSESSAYRDSVAFRAAFPGEAGPDRLWTAIGDQVSAREKAPAIAEACSAMWKGASSAAT